MRLAWIVVALVLVAPALAGAYTYNAADYPRTRQLVVEGHSVFATVQATFCHGVDGEVRRCAVPSEGGEVPVAQAPAAAVGLASETRWFNDQVLVGQGGSAVAVLARDAVFDPYAGEAPWRHPCGGWIFAAAPQAPDPRGVLPLWTYEESYRITDPLGSVWTVDRFRVAAVDVFAVPVLNLDVFDPGPASGVDCPAIVDSAPHDQLTYHAGYGWPERLYNALLWFPPGAGAPAPVVKMHGDGGLNDLDLTGCQANTEWFCAASDAHEGNSHPYNPWRAGSGAPHAHLTGEMALYFSNVPPPAVAVRDWAVWDTEGAAAPYP